MVGLFTIERAGRRKLILVSIFGSALSLGLLSGGFYWSHQVEPLVQSNRTQSHCNTYINQGKGFKSQNRKRVFGKRYKNCLEIHKLKIFVETEDW